ncbi:hypothetical protein C0995_009334 [Termitomyces sp. Mi166|nr:hypothetical protein C0995_009334 [Termitomyces sp. Mi166\
MNDHIRLWDLAGSHVWYAPSVTSAWIHIPFLNMTKSKSCHVKNFGTRDLRHANLPHRDITSESDIPHSPPPLLNPLLTTPPRVPSPLRKYNPDGDLIDPNVAAPRLPASSMDPFGFKSGNTSESPESNNTESIREAPTTPLREPVPAPLVGTPSNTGRPGLGGIPRTIALTPTRSGAYPAPPRHAANTSIGGMSSQTLGEANPSDNASITAPVFQTATGTRYGAALTSNVTGNMGSPKRWAASTNPSCPRCGKIVYFAEQVFT